MNGKPKKKSLVDNFFKLASLLNGSFTPLKYFIGICFSNFKEFSSDFWCVPQFDITGDSLQAAWGYCTGQCPQNCNETMYVFIIIQFAF